MRILLTNDDGINAYGLRAIHKALAERGHDVLPVAPLSQQSAASSRLTIRGSLSLRTVRDDAFLGIGVDGSPADCVKAALAAFFSEPGNRPDLVVSGINDGHNLGIDVVYSGTVGAALDGALYGIPAIAVSRRETDATDIDAVAAHAAAFIDSLDWSKKNGKLLNLNYPSVPLSETRGMRVCPLSRIAWKAVYRKEILDEENTRLVVSQFTYRDDTPLDATPTDWVLIRDGYITLTPLVTDMTDCACLSDLKAETENF